MFNIQFSGLSLGHHAFEFHVDDVIFQQRNGTPPVYKGYDEIFDCNVVVNINLEKTERFLKLGFIFLGTYSVPCDRCLDPVQISINQRETLIVNFGEETNFEDEVWEISSKEHRLMLDDFIYETLVLLRPFSVMHEIEDCNQDMLVQLQPPSQQESESDPRWDTLKLVKTKK
jgi:uncharacterized metal-binding protein YceD (DUF177 family)